MKRLLFVALIPALALAQEKRTEAEELFEKAWWEESASGALDKALDGYRKAADAAGPASIRARAVYRAAIVEQRLGRTDAAVALLERLAKDFPGETDLLKESKARLQEWTAVDLRKSFSEWYRSYVFSPEFQARVVDLVLRLGTGKQEERQEVRDQLLTIGEAAVPALEEALKSSNEQLCQAATKLLLDLGVVPPTGALIRYPSWVGNGESRWLVIFQADEATRKRVREEAKGDEPLARALRAVTTSPDEMLSFAVSESDYPAPYVLGLLYRNGGDAMRKRLEALISEPSVPAYIVGYLRSFLPQGPEGVDMARCLEWARVLPTRAARQAAAGWAVNRLTEKSDQDLDAVLALIADPGDALVTDLAIPVLDALANRGPGLAWTPARVGVLLDLFTRLEEAGKSVDLGRRTLEPASDAPGCLYRVLSNLRTYEPAAVALADALLDRWARNWARRGSGWRNLATGGVTVHHGSITVRTEEGGVQQWGKLFMERAIARWPKASREDKVAILGVAAETSDMRTAVVTALGDELSSEAVGRDTDPELRHAIASFLGGVPVSKLLASFDLSTANGAKAAMDALDGTVNTRDANSCVPMMGEILAHGDSATRGRALEMLRGWRWDNLPSLVPAAKAVAEDESAVVRLWAINRLADWNSFDAAPYLVKALADPDADVRASAAGGLARVGREDAVPALVKLLDDRAPAVREAALKALEQIRKIADVKKAWQLEQAGLR